MNHQKVITMTLIGLMTAVTCILAPLSIAIPISVVPISFTNLVVYISAVILGWKKGTISYLVYLFIGLAGLPVFSGFSSGPAKLLGPTGGYLIGFIFTALVTGFFADKFSDKIYMYVSGMVLGTIIAYAFAAGWLAYQSEMTFRAALITGVVPFIIGDIAKIAIAAILGVTVKKQIKKAGYL